MDIATVQCHIPITGFQEGPMVYADVQDCFISLHYSAQAEDIMIQNRYPLKE